MALWQKLRLHKKLLDEIQRTGEKNGTKRNILVDGRGVPLSIVVTGANRHDVTQLKAVLEHIVVKRPDTEQYLCADKGYQGKPALLIILAEEYVPHVKQLNEEVQEKRDNPNYKARRWVVEVSHSWFNRFRKILVRFEKLNERYEALLFMAASIIALRKVGFIYE